MKRFSRSKSCPICGGWDNAPRGRGKRCFGFLSEDGTWAHCTREEFAGSLTMNTKSSTYAHSLRSICKCGKGHHGALSSGSVDSTQRKIIATYDYKDAKGALLFQVVRWQPKSFSQRRPDGNGRWIWNLHGVRTVLYRLPELASADPQEPIFLPEGEKDVDNLARLGVVCATSPMGAGKWRVEYSEALRGRKVVLLPDNDQKGKEHMQAVARSLRGVARSVKIVELPNLREKGDVSNWLSAGGTLEALHELVAKAYEYGEIDDHSWRSIFHTWEEFENAPPLRFAIDGFLQEAGVTLIGGLSGHGKTLVMLEMAKALLEQLPPFGYEPFAVPRPARRVLYLIPECALGPFRVRVELFRLQEHVRSDRLLVQTLSSGYQISLTDPLLLKAAEGADVFLDTAVRFMSGSENDVESARPFAGELFRLLSSGARSITGAHHAPKGFETQDFMTLENILRGSGDLGAMVCTCWGVRQIDPVRNRLYVQNVKPRDFQPCAPFVLEGRPHLDNSGHFVMTHRPGNAGELSEHLARRKRCGRPATPERDEKLAEAVALRADGLSLREIADKIKVAKSTLDRWLFDYDASQKCPAVGQFRDEAEPDGETPN